MKESKAMGVMMKCAVLALAAAMLCGCAGKYGSVLEPEQVATVVRGKTTKAQVLAMFGDPDKAEDLGGGREEIFYIREDVSAHGTWFHSNNRAHWFAFKNGVVDAFGEHATADQPRRFWWGPKRQLVWW